MKKVLVIDDDPDILEALRLTLEMGGYNADGTTKCDETYQKVDAYKPDVILLDVLLSGDDGRLICQRLKSRKKTSAIPVIMMSAHPSAKRTVKEYGADSFIAKPFSVADLLAEIKKFTNKN